MSSFQHLQLKEAKQAPVKPVIVHKPWELFLAIFSPLLTLLIQMTITVVNMKVPWNKKR